MSSQLPIRGLVAAILACATWGWTAPAAAITASVLDLCVTRDGVAFFRDSFTDGLPPPSAPNYASGAMASSLVGGFFVAGSESGGSLTLSSANGVLGSSSPGQATQTQRMTLTSDNDPLDLTRGLKLVHIFTTWALIDLAGATVEGSFELRFTDRRSASGGGTIVDSVAAVDDVPSAQIVRLRTNDFVAGTANKIGQIGVDQVRLILSRTTPGSPQVFASAEFFDEGESLGIFNLPGSASLFVHNGFARAELAAGETYPGTTDLCHDARGPWARRLAVAQKDTSLALAPTSPLTHHAPCRASALQRTTRAVSRWQSGASLRPA